MRFFRVVVASAVLAVAAMGCGSGAEDAGDSNAPDAAATGDDEASAGDSPSPLDVLASRDGSEDGAAADPCAADPPGTFTSVAVVGGGTPSPATQPDVNVKLRGFAPTGGTLGLVDLSGPTDPKAPRLEGLFADLRIPTFVLNERVHAWDWNTMTPMAAFEAGDVHRSTFATTPGETIGLPSGGYEIAPGLQAHVLFVDADSITMNDTAQDSVASGYTIHVFGVCIDAGLRARYVADDAAGRHALPALAGRQVFGRARGAAISVVIRDTGTFMDPRSHKDWW